MNLNDLYFFHCVALHKGFSAASRATGIPKATLSKRVAYLEHRLGVRLLERSTRGLRPTETGEAVYKQVESLIAGAEAVEGVVASARGEPGGLVRASCPQGLLQDLLIDLLPAFLHRFPKVRVQLKVINRRVDLVEDGVDVALRASVGLDADPNLVMRQLGQTRSHLVASPGLLDKLKADITVERLSVLPTLSLYEERGEAVWQLLGPRGDVRDIRHTPRLMCSSFDVLRTSAVAGLGVALLPDFVIGRAVADGHLVHVVPDWYAPNGIIQAIFSSRHGMLPATRAWIDFLAQEVPRRLSVGAA